MIYSTRRGEQSVRRQAGAATLIVTVVLLALLTVTVLVVSQNVSLELRTSANINRDKEALAVAQGAAEYGAVIYLADRSITSNSLTVPITTSGAPATYTVSENSGVITVAGQGRSTDLSANKTVFEDYGIFAEGAFGDVPPLMAGGTFPPGGTFSIIANPNGGGNGVPASAWAQDATGNGSWQTCQLDEYLNTSVSGVFDEQSDGYRVCSDCSCGAAEKLCDGNSVTDGRDCDDIVDATESCLPDTFENLFNRNVVDLSASSGYSGTACVDNDVKNDDGSVVSSTTPSAYLTENAVRIDDCDDLNSASGEQEFIDTNGFPLLWYNPADVSSDCVLHHQVGSYEKPVVLVTTSETVRINAGAEFYGILFILDCSLVDYNDTNCPISVTPTITANGGARLYGSMIVSENVSLPTGGMSLIWAPGVLEAVTNNEDGWEGLARRAGSWRDYN